MPFRSLMAQIGGDGTFEFVNIPITAKIAGLGGYNVSHPDDHLDNMYLNPALLRDSLDQSMSFSWTPYLADINAFNAIYGFKKIPKIDIATIGLTYFNYGEFLRVDENGETDGSYYSASAYNLQITDTQSLS